MKPDWMSAETDKRIRLACDLLFAQNLTETTRLYRNCALFLVWAAICWTNDRNMAAGMQEANGGMYAFFLVCRSLNWLNAILMLSVHASGVAGYFWDRHVKHHH
jgi:hypothetical protein